MGGRRPWIVLALVLIAVSVAWGAALIRDRRFDAAVAEARRAREAGRFEAAAKMLGELAACRPHRGDVLYDLGLCEQARRRTRAALAAWGKVPAGSPFAGRAAVGTARVEMGLGRYARAEEAYRRALASPGPHAADALWGLVLLLRLEGRFDEARRLFVLGLDAMPDPADALRKLYHLDTDPLPTEGLRRSLEMAARHAPEDDRILLGRANLETRLGRFDEAARLLDACRRARLDDEAVWDATLELALAADRVDLASQALAHLPAEPRAPGRLEALRAWLAAHEGDADAERRALEERARIVPGDIRTLDRLAELELAAGRPERARAYRARRAALEEARNAYEAALGAPDPAARAAKLARLATALGRPTDAGRWDALARGERTAPAPVVLKPDAPEVRRPTLASLLPAPKGRSARSGTAAGVIPQFADGADHARLSFVHDNGAAADRLVPPVSVSGGLGLLDYDGDGWLDLYVVQGGAFPPEPAPHPSGDRLFRNRGDGSFEDVSERSGIAGMPGGYGFGVAVGDYDNDGRPDLFVTRWKSYALYRNAGGGRFEDATASAGLGGGRDWPTSAAFADLDGDGDLDLYVCHYLSWDERDTRACVSPRDPSKYHCNPTNFPALADHLFRNDGGQFVDVTESAGIVDRDGRGLGVVAADLDDDGRTDLYVANDMSANYLWRNLGGFRFEEVAHESGAAANGAGGYQAGMGTACGDLDGDGRMDLLVTNFFNESTTFFQQIGPGLFADHTAAIGLAVPSRYLLGFGIVLFEANNDGRLDVMTANGHIHDGRPQFPWMMPAQLLIGGSGGRLTDVSERAGSLFAATHLGRGLAAGDIDNDGRVDALLLGQNEPVAVFANRTEGGHSVTFRLEGRASNRDGVGARVTLTAGGRRQVVARNGGGSFESASDPRLHFGLGQAARVDLVEVRWPSGRVDRHEGLAADAGYRLREGDARPSPLEGWPRRATSPEGERSGR